MKKLKLKTLGNSSVSAAFGFSLNADCTAVERTQFIAQQKQKIERKFDPSVFLRFERVDIIPRESYRDPCEIIYINATITGIKEQQVKALFEADFPVIVVED